MAGHRVCLVLVMKKDWYSKACLKTISAIMTRTGETLASVESVTAGHIQSALSMARAMYFFEGGITTFNLKQKSAILAVNTTIAIPVYLPATLSIAGKGS